ncbi:NACHT, LRR and PYD domains-containing protein 2-like [Erinaceus europaeus]|uniref:NACHT, LRR and PYD domains-containing protein 2-like n=1 Tax=Erinaceus europaeus TaxID=9365 RepID=A0ABM3X103_ERIEU|nr:NACHT, LRR and PYD domains-containing protein 2-like [Erinaceus europaeus]
MQGGRETPPRPLFDLEPILQQLSLDELEMFKELLWDMTPFEELLEELPQSEVNRANGLQLARLLARHSNSTWVELLTLHLLCRVGRRDLYNMAWEKATGGGIWLAALLCIDLSGRWGRDWKDTVAQSFPEPRFSNLARVVVEGAGASQVSLQAGGLSRSREQRVREEPDHVDEFLRRLESGEELEVQEEEEDEKNLVQEEIQTESGTWLEYRDTLSKQLEASWKSNFWPADLQVGEQMQEAIRQHMALLPFYRDGQPWQSFSCHSTLVLSGPAGVGKTTAAKQLVLDWLSGRLPGSWSTVFYLSCPELNHCGPSSLADLLSRGRADLRAAMPELLARPERVLLVVDGLDQLQAVEGAFMSGLCRDWAEVQPLPVVLGSLLSKVLLSQATVLVTMRTPSRQDVRLLLREAEVLQLRGLREQDQRWLFLQHLGLEEEKPGALWALKSLQDHLAVQELVRAPAMCWAAAACLRPQVEQDQNVDPMCTTATRLVLGFFRCRFRPHPRLRVPLASVCLLAAHCVWMRRSVFSGPDLQQLGVMEQHLYPFLEAKVLRQHDDWGRCYSFLHLAVQQLLAAAFYVLEYKQQGAIQDMASVFSPQERMLNPYLARVGDFLFGFTHSENTWQLEAAFQVHRAQSFRYQLLRHVMQLEYEQLPARFTREQHPTRFTRELLRGLYETQDAQLLRELGPRFSKLALELGSKQEVMHAGFCLRCLRDLQSLRLQVHSNVFHQVPEDDADDEDKLQLYLEQTGPAEDTLQDNGLVIPSWTDLCSVLETNWKLTDLKISFSHLSAASVRVLCDKMALPSCQLQKLVISSVSPEAAYREFCAALCGHKTLMHLTLKEHKQEDLLPLLCELLQHSGCKLQSLRLKSCAGTSQQWVSLAASVDHSSLVCLNIVNGKVLDKGALRLCRTLAQPTCMLQRVALEKCHLTEACCKGLSYILRDSKRLTHLSLAQNALGDQGLKLLCEGLNSLTCALQTLVLWGCSISSTGCRELAMAVTQYSKLQHLDLGMNPIGSSGLKFLCDSLTKPLCVLKTLWSLVPASIESNIDLALALKGPLGFVRPAG